MRGGYEQQRDLVVEDSLIAFTDQGAARLAAVTIRQLRYWQETGLLRPGTSQSVSQRKVVRLYSFDELVALLVIAQLRDQFSLQLIRKIVARLQDQGQDQGYERPLSELHFATAGGEIFFQHSDGTWEGNRQPDQIVLEHVLRVEPLRAKVRLHSRHGRDPAAAGQIERRRRIMGSKPVFAGTRMPVSALFPYLRRGHTVEQVLEAFPHLEAADVEAARAQLAAADSS